MMDEGVVDDSRAAKYNVNRTDSPKKNPLSARSERQIN